MQLSDRQSQIVEFIKDFTKREGFAPTISEMAEGIGVNPNAIQYQINRLDDAGVITRQACRSRTIRVVNE